MTEMTILLVDDHPLFLEGLQNLLRARGIGVVGMASDGMQALEMARSLKPSVILMDIQMPICDGLTATRLIKAEMPGIKIVMLTVSADDEHLFEAIKCGASGYLLKSLDADQFFDLLDGVIRGEAALPRNLAARVLQEFAQQAQRSTAPTETDETSTESDLTPRQIDVLQLVAQGLSNREIADRLFIAESTVKYHMREILSKLHLRNRGQVIAYALREGLIPGNTAPPDR